MKRIDLKTLPIPNKKEEFFRKIDIAPMINGEYFENDYASFEIDNFIQLVNNDFNSLFFTNAALTHVNFQEEIVLKDSTVNIVQSLKSPLVVFHLYDTKDSYLKNHLSYHVKENVTADIIEIFISKAQGNFIDEQRSFELEQDSTLSYSKVQQLSIKDFINIQFIQTLKKHSTFNSYSFDYGALRAINIWETNLNCPNSNFHMEGIVKLNQTQETANIVQTHHNEKNTQSSINVTHILDNESHGIYEVKSIVNKTAQYASALQNSKTILLNDNAKIHANPRLEIFTDELSASHGATTGSLNEDMLYYLQTRGLSKQSAQTILLEALEDTLFDKIPNYQVRNFIKRIIKEF